MVIFTAYHLPNTLILTVPGQLYSSFRLGSLDRYLLKAEFLVRDELVEPTISSPFSESAKSLLVARLVASVLSRIGVCRGGANSHCASLAEGFDQCLIVLHFSLILVCLM